MAVNYLFTAAYAHLPTAGVEIRLALKAVKVIVIVLIAGVIISRIASLNRESAMLHALLAATLTKMLDLAINAVFLGHLSTINGLLGAVTGVFLVSVVAVFVSKRTHAS